MDDSDGVGQPPADLRIAEHAAEVGVLVENRTGQRQVVGLIGRRDQPLVRERVQVRIHVSHSGRSALSTVTTAAAVSSTT